MNQPFHLVGDVEESIARPSGGVETFEAFVLSNHARLYAALCLVTRDRFEAEEIAQEAFVRILERWERVRAVEDPTGYLFRTAMNVFRKRYRRAMLAVRKATSIAPRDEGFEQIEDRDVVVRAVAKLPTEQRAALVTTSLLGFPPRKPGASSVSGRQPCGLARRGLARPSAKRLVRNDDRRARSPRAHAEAFPRGAGGR